jgi:hypothetical protein
MRYKTDGVNDNTVKLAEVFIYIFFVIVAISVTVKGL